MHSSNVLSFFSPGHRAQLHLLAFCACGGQCMGLSSILRRSECTISCFYGIQTDSLVPVDSSVCLQTSLCPRSKFYQGDVPNIVPAWLKEAPPMLAFVFPILHTRTEWKVLQRPQGGRGPCREESSFQGEPPGGVP